jgi:4-diphosphocytidyl-2-C-methyl-D-erythritol kinase
LEPSPDIGFESNNTSLPADESNLCIRAAKLLQQHAGISLGARIRLIKNIPIGSGLGGGSSDAATTLLGLIKLWNISITKEELTALALQLGSDVPYFLNQGTAYATGRGEILEYFELNIPHWIVLVCPNVHISTAWAYKEIHNSQITTHNLQLKTQDSKLITQTSNLKTLLLDNINNPQQLNPLLHNDFEPLVLHKHKSIAFLKISLYATGAKFAQMSGSGSSVYGFYTDEKDAMNAVNKFSKSYRVFSTPPNFSPS